MRFILIAIFIISLVAVIVSIPRIIDLLPSDELIEYNRVKLVIYCYETSQTAFYKDSARIGKIDELGKTGWDITILKEFRSFKIDTIQNGLKVVFLRNYHGCRSGTFIIVKAEKDKNGGLKFTRYYSSRCTKRFKNINGNNLYLN